MFLIDPDNQINVQTFKKLQQQENICDWKIKMLNTKYSKLKSFIRLH